MRGAIFGPRTGLPPLIRLAQEDWQTWLNGIPQDAQRVIQVLELALFDAAPAA